jgi:hypothetical protein
MKKCIIVMLCVLCCGWAQGSIFSPSVDTFVTASVGWQQASEGPDRPSDSSILSVVASPSTAVCNVTYIKFDISAFSRNIDSATFSFTLAESFNSEWYSPGYVYGVKDSFDTWDPTLPVDGTYIFWADAPAYNSNFASDYNPVDASKVIELMAIPGRAPGNFYAAGDTITVTGDVLKNFLAADTNKSITIAISGYAWGQPTLKVASSENTTYAGPSLELIPPQNCGDTGTEILGDLNGDCYVNFTDLALMAEDWGRCTDPADSLCNQ